MAKEINTVYVIYAIDSIENDFSCLEVFTDHTEAKRFVEEHKGECAIWERPLRNAKKEED